MLVRALTQGRERNPHHHTGEPTGGGLRTLRHVDQGSLLTIDVLLTDPADIEGGVLQVRARVRVRVRVRIRIRVRVRVRVRVRD